MDLGKGSRQREKKERKEKKEKTGSEVLNGSRSHLIYRHSLDIAYYFTYIYQWLSYRFLLNFSAIV